MNVSRLAVLILFVLATALPYSAEAASAVWTVHAEPGAQNWTGIASSGDGTRLAATVTGGNIWLSSDSGATWATSTSAGVQAWRAITMSADGMKLAAVVSSGHIWTSVDYGATWTDRSAPGTRDWITIASTADGASLIAMPSSGLVYTSFDSGANWTQRNGTGTQSWRSVAMSSSGTDAYAMTSSGVVFYSQTGGSLWSVREGSLLGDGRGIDTSSDGAKVVGTLSGGNIILSSDRGVTWASSTPAGIRDWRPVAMSSDGATVLAGDYGTGNTPVAIGSLYTTINSGTAWTNQTNVSENNWRGVAMSSSGTKLSAVGYGDFIYTADLSLETDPPVISGRSVSVATSSATISWTTNEAASVTLQYGLSSSYTTAAATTTLTTSHSYTLTGLTPATTYHYSIQVSDALTNATSTADATFTTVTPDTTPPVLSGPAAGTTATYAVISWLTDELADSYLQFGTTTAYGTATTSATLETGHTLRMAGLTPATLYHYRYRSTDAQGNASTSVDYTLTTSAVDTVAPTLTFLGTTTAQTAADITWDTNEASYGAVSYGLSASYGSVASSSTFGGSHTLALSGLSPGTAYHFRITMTDDSGNLATTSDYVFTTLSPDETASEDTSRSRSRSGSSVSSRVAALASSGNVAAASVLLSEYPSLDRSSLIQVLVAKLAELQAQLAALSDTATSVRDLEAEAEGDDVLRLQQLLIAAKSDAAAEALANNGATRYFGTLTRAALMEYQEAHGIAPASGYFGPATRAQMAVSGLAVWW